MSRRKVNVLGLFNAIMVAFMLAPLVMVILVSFTPDRFMQVPSRPSLRWYLAILDNSPFIMSFLLSGLLAVVAAAVSTCVGFLASFAIVRRDFPGKPLIDAFLMAPMTVPLVAVGVAVLQFFIRIGLYNSFFGLAMVHVVITLPYVMRTVTASLKTIPPDLEFASLNLGADWVRTLWHITVPLAKRGIFAGFVFALVISFSELTATLFIAGPALQTLPIRIYNYLHDIAEPLVASVSASIIFLSIILMLVLDRLVGLQNLFGQ